MRSIRASCIGKAYSWSAVFVGLRWRLGRRLLDPLITDRVLWVLASRSFGWHRDGLCFFQELRKRLHAGIYTRDKWGIV